MDIMPTTSVDFQALADAVVRDFTLSGEPLEDGVVKTATSLSLTPEEIRRLVEKTNTAASLHLLKTAEDKKSVFALAETGRVLARTHPVRDAPQAKTAAVYTGLFPNKEPGLEKAAAAAPPPAVDREFSGADAARALHKELEARKLQKVAAERVVQDALEYLAAEFSLLRGPDFSKFAADSRALFGSLAEPVLQSLSGHLRTDLAKTAAAPGFVDDTTRHMRAMRCVCEGIQRLIKTAESVGELEQARNHYLSEAKNGAMS